MSWIWVLLLACGSPEAVGVAGAPVSRTVPATRDLATPGATAEEVAIPDALLPWLGEKPGFPPGLTGLAFGMPLDKVEPAYGALLRPGAKALVESDPEDPRIFLGASHRELPEVGYTLVVDVSGPGLTEVQVSLPDAYGRRAVEAAWGPPAPGAVPTWTAEGLVATLHDAEEKSLLSVRVASVEAPGGRIAGAAPVPTR